MRNLVAICLLAVCTICSAKIPVKLNKRTYYLNAEASEKDMRANAHVYRDAVRLLQDIDTVEATVYVAPGVYWIDDPDDKTVRKGINGEAPIGLSVRCRNLTLAGMDEDAAKTVFASQRGQTMGAVGNFTMFHFFCDSLRMENLTLGNYVNVDLTYPGKPQLSRKRISDNIVQAQLAFMTGKLFSATNCRFLSRLNLCPVIGAEETAYKDCHFESTDDALNGNAVYTNCTFDFYSGKPLFSTSGMGAFFEHCTFNIRHNGAQYLTKHPSPVTLVDCRFIGKHGQHIGWTPYPSRSLRCIQSGVWLNDSMIVVGADHPENTIILPALTHRQFVKMDCQPAIIRDGETTQISLSPILGNDSLTHLTLVARTDGGYEAATEIDVLPKHLAAPLFSQQPAWRIADGAATTAYSFTGNKRADQSQVTWTRIRKDGARITVAESTSGVPATDYRLRPEDVGCQLEANIVPRQYETDAAVPQTLLTRVIAQKDVMRQDTLVTDFRNMPLGNHTLQEGAWTFTGFKPADTQEYPWTVDAGKSYWRYGASDNGCVGTGLTQTAQGARMVYTPIHGEYGDMSLQLLADPQKTAGQGFSSATGQYMDIFIKYDTQRMAGYALRIIRTTKFSNAVDFMLMKYADGGIPEAISEPVTSPCYRTGCQIALSYKDGVLRASAKTSTPLDSTSSLPREVHLEAQVEGNNFGGFGIQHTGTTGEGQTMLHELRVAY